MLKNYYKKIRKKQDNDVDPDVTQLECNNNKYYASVFRYIQIYIDDGFSNRFSTFQDQITANMRYTTFHSNSHLGSKSWFQL